MVCKAHVSWIMVYKGLLWKDGFWVSYVKWCKFYNNNLLVVLGSKQGDDVETREPQARGLSVNSIADSLFLTFLIYFAEMWNYFLMKVNKRKSWKCLKCVKEYSRRFYLANWKFLSIFLGIFARIAKVAHFAQVINFRERAHRKTHPCKVDKNNRESAFLFAFVFFFRRNSKTKFFVPSSTQQQKQKVSCPFFFVGFVSQMGSLPMRL